MSLRNLSGFIDRYFKDIIWVLEKFGGMACIKKFKLEVERRGIESDVTKEKVWVCNVIEVEWCYFF